MAAIIFTVGMAVARRTALVAMRDNLIRYTFAHPLVKNKIFANKTHRQALLARLTGVFNNSALDMPDFVESVMFHPGTGLFTTNAAGAVHDDFFIFMCLHHLDCFWQLLTEGICRNFERVFNVPHFILIVVTHVDKQCIGIVKHGVHFRRLQILTNIAGIKVRIVNTVGNDTIADLHAQYPEGFPVIIQRDIQA